MKRAVVAILKTTPERVFEDIRKLMEMAGVKEALKAEATTILKDNISWHFPFLSANTTPWQLEGTIRGLKAAGFSDLVAVHNNTVVTNPFKGGRLNKLEPIYRRYGIPEKYNFLPEHMTWEVFRPKARMRVLDQIYPKGIQVPSFFWEKHRSSAHGKMSHLYHDHRVHEKCLWRAPHHPASLHAQRHPRDPCRSSGDTEGDPSGDLHRHGCDLLRQWAGPRTMIPVEKGLMLASSDSVAIDAVAAKIMGFEPMKIDYIRLAHEDGLGVGRIEEIEVLGEDISGMNFRFSVGDNLASRVGRSVLVWSVKKISKALLPYPSGLSFRLWVLTSIMIGSGGLLWENVS